MDCIDIPYLIYLRFIDLAGFHWQYVRENQGDNTHISKGLFIQGCRDQLMGGRGGYQTYFSEWTR